MTTPTDPANAAIRNAACRPTASATSPQSSAPTVIEPVKITVYTARPRARTHAGKNKCSSPVNVGVAAIRASPANTRVATAAGKPADQHERSRSCGVVQAGGAQLPVIRQPVSHPSQQHRTDNGADA